MIKQLLILAAFTSGCSENDIVNIVSNDFNKYTVRPINYYNLNPGHTLKCSDYGLDNQYLVLRNCTYMYKTIKTIKCIDGMCFEEGNN